MLVYDYYDGDDNRRVKLIQLRLYGDVIARLVRRLGERCRLYEESLVVHTLAGTLLDHANQFDHRTIQRVHDLIAARFRYRHARPTLFDDLQADGDWENQWLTWVDTEWERLLDEPEFFRAVVASVALGNTTTGLAAERSAEAALLDVYRDVPWIRCQD